MHTNRIVDITTDKLSERKMSLFNNSGHFEGNLEKLEFCTSTPKKTGSSSFDEEKDKKKFKCENCLNKSQCDE